MTVCVTDAIFVCVSAANTHVSSLRSTSMRDHLFRFHTPDCIPTRWGGGGGFSVRSTVFDDSRVRNVGVSRFNRCVSTSLTSTAPAPLLQTPPSVPGGSWMHLRRTFALLRGGIGGPYCCVALFRPFVHGGLRLFGPWMLRCMASSLSPYDFQSCTKLARVLARPAAHRVGML